jgi:hypothetical protein
MTKTPSDKLHLLIRSLTSAEKRYFRIAAGGKTEQDSKYIRMFDTLAEMEKYNSGAVQSRVYHSVKVEGKKYTELKAYLYDLIVKSLQSYDEQQSVENRINHLLRGVAALFKRGLYADCEELLHKALKIALKYELFTQQLEIYRWKKHLAYTKMDVHFLHTQLEKLDYDEQQALQKLNHFTAYRKAFFEVYSLIKKDSFQRDPYHIEVLKNLLPESLFESPEKPDSYRSLILFYRTVNLYFYAIQDTASFYDTGKNLIQSIEKKPYMLSEILSDYISSLSNYMLACGLTQRYDEVNIALEKLRELKAITEDDRRKIHRQYFTTLFALCQFTGEFVKARTELTRCQEEAVVLHSHDYETSSFFFQYFYISFGCGDFEEALRYLNLWLAQPRSSEREDLQSLARILGLLVHFELGNMLLLESLIRSTKRFLRQKNRLYMLEKQFIDLISDLIKAPTAEEIRIRIRKFGEGWNKIESADSINQIFDLKAWIDAKVNKKSYAETIKENWKRKKDTR